MEVSVWDRVVGPLVELWPALLLLATFAWAGWYAFRHDLDAMKSDVDENKRGVKRNSTAINDLSTHTASERSAIRESMVTQEDIKEVKQLIQTQSQQHAEQYADIMRYLRDNAKR
jgi:hypothetical protein